MRPFRLGSGDVGLVEPLLDRLGELYLAVVTTGPAGRPAPLVKRLHDRGIRVAGGSDNVRDAWSTYGNADMLERAMLIGQRNDCRTDAEVELALQLCSFDGASVLRLKDYGLAETNAADLILVQAETVAHAVVARPPRRLVVKRGQVVARAGRLVEGAASLVDWSGKQSV